jgi:hypothetical protein
LTQSILHLITKYAVQVKKNLPSSIKIKECGEGRYSQVRILRHNARKKLLNKIATHICCIAFLSLSIARQPKQIQNTIFLYIRKPDLTPKEISSVEDGPFFTDDTQGALMLVQGLIARRVLRFALFSKH